MGENIHKSDIWNLYLEYIMNSYNSMVKKQPDVNGHFLKKIYKYPMRTWEDAQRHYASEKYKSELQDITSHTTRMVIILK